MTDGAPDASQQAATVRKRAGGRPLLPIAVTMGEPAGIGGELTIRAWLARHRMHIPPFFVIDDPARLTALALRLGIALRVRAISSPSDVGESFDHALPVLPLELTKPVKPGNPDPGLAPAVIDSIDQAVGFVRSGQAFAVVTNPIQKETLYQAGFRYAGHTEYLGTLCGGVKPVMMLACEGLRVCPVTIHLPLKAVPEALTRDDILDCGRITAAALETDFGISRPRLAVAGLNPHAGERGSLGDEEIRIIRPAVEALEADGIDIFGPAPADTLFHADARDGYDAVLCMYHDQALIPIKTLDFFGGVNITLGLPLVRTSPDHGTALTIAGTGLANPKSFLAALTTAAVLAENRASLGGGAPVFGSR